MPKKKSDSAVDAAAQTQPAAPAAESQVPAQQAETNQEATQPEAVVDAPAVEPAAQPAAEVAEPKKSTAKPKAAAGPAPKTMEELLASTSYAVVVPKRGTTVTGKVTGKSRKMLTVDIGAKTEGVVTDKEYEVASEYIDELEVGQEIEAVVVSAENNQGQVMLSLKKAANEAKWDYFAEALEKDMVLDAKAIDVNKGGLIVIVNGARGFVPSSQFGKGLVGSFHKLKGQVVKVKAIEVDREKNRLIFSERHVSEAQEIAQKSQALESVKAGEIYSGVVSGVMHFGLFVTVEVPIADSQTPGHVEGLVHISEISWEKVVHPKEYHKVGDKVQVRVLGVDEKTGKLNLSIKQLTDDPWKSIEERYQPGTTVSGTVSRVEPFGVFVNVEAGIDGLIHSSKLEPGQQLSRGEKITVHVESVDSEQRRMSLSLVMTELPIEYK